VPPPSPFRSRSSYPFKLRKQARRPDVRTPNLKTYAAPASLWRVSSTSMRESLGRFSCAPSLILSVVHAGSYATSTSTASTAGRPLTSSLIISKSRAANGHQPLVCTILDPLFAVPDLDSFDKPHVDDAYLPIPAARAVTVVQSPDHRLPARRRHLLAGDNYSPLHALLLSRPHALRKP
jgi:hypothetical protein